jgi:hypothetical protein
MRQKEIDLFSAENALEGVSSVSGEVENGLVPYHVPTCVSFCFILFLLLASPPLRADTHGCEHRSAHPVGSSTMILGGFGFLSRSRGLSVDNIVEVEMVLADGRIIVVDKDEDPGMHPLLPLPAC